MTQRGRPKKIEQTEPVQTNIEKINNIVESNQSKLSMILGALIILVIVILIFNFFNKSKSDLGPAQQTDQTQQENTGNNLIDKYTIKEGDTLFLIAEKFYNDGSKFTEIAKANNINDINLIETGQVLQIPKIAESTLTPLPTPTPDASSPSETPEATASPEITPTSLSLPQVLISDSSTLTPWGPKINGNTYVVTEGDWLSKIAGRAYGDIFAYKKLAQVNNIPNPDLIFPGQVLTIPR